MITLQDNSNSYFYTRFDIISNDRISFIIDLRSHLKYWSYYS